MPKLSQLYGLAEENDGIFLASAARTHFGISGAALVNLERRGHLQRLERGVYRLVAYPPSPLEQFRQASFGLTVQQPLTNPVISHESALLLHELSDVNPDKIHLTINPTIRLRRRTPPFITLHRQNLSLVDVIDFEGFRITSIDRTL